MELHFGKFQLITTRSSPSAIRTPTDVQVDAKAGMEYLAAVIHGDGCADHEVSRRIAIARADFDSLAKTWTHSS